MALVVKVRRGTHQVCGVTDGGHDERIAVAGRDPGCALPCVAREVAPRCPVRIHSDPVRAAAVDKPSGPRYGRVTSVLQTLNSVPGLALLLSKRDIDPAS